jgi:hypothetical protein
MRSPPSADAFSSARDTAALHREGNAPGATGRSGQGVRVERHGCRCEIERRGGGTTAGPTRPGPWGRVCGEGSSRRRRHPDRARRRRPSHRHPARWRQGAAWHRAASGSSGDAAPGIAAGPAAPPRSSATRAVPPIWPSRPRSTVPARRRFQPHAARSEGIEADQVPRRQRLHLSQAARGAHKTASRRRSAPPPSQPPAPAPILGRHSRPEAPTARGAGPAGAGQNKHRLPCARRPRPDRSGRQHVIGPVGQQQVELPAIHDPAAEIHPFRASRDPPVLAVSREKAARREVDEIAAQRLVDAGHGRGGNSVGSTRPVVCTSTSASMAPWHSAISPRAPSRSSSTAISPCSGNRQAPVRQAICSRTSVRWGQVQRLERHRRMPERPLPGRRQHVRAVARRRRLPAMGGDDTGQNACPARSAGWWGVGHARNAARTWRGRPVVPRRGLRKSLLGHRPGGHVGLGQPAGRCTTNRVPARPGW